MPAARDGERDVPQLARVAGDGTIRVPLVGSVAVSGLEPFEASQNIVAAARSRGIYRQPHVSVEIKKKAVNRITVMGAVAEPGVHDVPRNSSDLVTALAAAGGLTEEAGTVVEITHHADDTMSTALAGEVSSAAVAAAGNDPAVQPASYGEPIFDPPAGHRTEHSTPTSPSMAARVVSPAAQPTRRRLDLTEEQPHSEDENRLADRDVVMVFPREERYIHVAGLVNDPGQFELPKNQDMHLLDAIAMAGDRSSPVADKILIIRRVDGQAEPLVIKASLSRAKRDGRENLRLTAGDLVSVEQTPATLVVDTITSLFRVSAGITSSAVAF